jgi:chromosome segregation ATPase
MTDDDLAEPLYDVSATWLLKERIEELESQLADKDECSGQWRAQLDAYQAENADLRRQLAEANDELLTWKAVFPDIAPRRVLPSTAIMLAEARNAALEEAASTMDNRRELHGDTPTGHVYEAAAFTIRALKTEQRNER